MTPCMEQFHPSLSGEPDNHHRPATIRCPHRKSMINQASIDSSQVRRPGREVLMDSLVQRGQANPNNQLSKSCSVFITMAKAKARRVNRAA